MSDSVTPVPKLPPGASLDQVRAWINSFQASYSQRDPNQSGASPQKYITFQSAADAGLVVYLGEGAQHPFVPPPVVTPPPDDSPPDPITGLTAQGGIGVIIVTFDPPTYTQGGGNGETIISAAVVPPGGPNPTFANAVPVYTCADSTSFAAIPYDPNETVAFWAQAVTRENVVQAAPTGGLHGVQATTGQDVTALLDVLTAAAQGGAYVTFEVRADLFYVGNSAGTYTDIPFFVTTVPIVQNGVTAPPGVYIRDAFIANGTITNAMIGNAVITDAKIANLSAGKITSGTISVGSVIQSSDYVAGVSGWKLNSGSAGLAEFANVIARGQIIASSGLIGGATINSTGVQSTNYVAGVSGWRLDNAAGKLFAVDADFYGNLVAATGTFAGNLSAAGGTFAGNLSAAGGTFAGNLSAAGGTFTGSLSAVNGTFSGTLTATHIVTTDNMVPNSVVEPVGATGTTTCSFSIDTLNKPLILWVYYKSFAGGAAGGSNSIILTVDKNGSTIFTDSQSAGPSDTSVGIAGCVPIYLVTPGSGSMTYTMTISTTGGFVAGSSNLTLVGLACHAS